MNKKSELSKTMFGSTLWNIWIWLTIVLVVLADVNVVVSLGIEGVGGWHLAIPIVFLALDVILALVAAFSNFRFRYSLVFPIIYAAFTVVIGIVGIIVYCAVLDYIVFTSFALISWMIFELLSVATILLSTIRASGKGMAFSIVTVVLVVIFAAYSIFYVIMVARDGFFGQGKSGSYSSEERTTTYRYDEETDTYIASGTLSGRGGTVLVTDSVNGKKVGEVDCSIFLGDGITSARLLCDGDVKFSNTECIASLPDDFTVTASCDAIDDFKTYFYDLSVATANGAVATYDAYTDSLRDAYADFANRITPEVEDGEVYIVFTYSYSDLQTLGVGNVLPTWIKNSGMAFEISDLLYEVEDSFMYENMDPSKEVNLYYYYTNYDKIILNELRDPDGNAIEGRSITAPMSVGVSYENIYAVSISTNDTVYEGTEEFSEMSDFSSSGYRYVTGSSADSLITNINETANARAGFTYKWTYGDGKSLSSLESVIEDGMEISLVWTLDAPEIELVSSASGTYGDAITIAPKVSHTNTSDVTYGYSWTLGGTSMGTSSNLAFSKAVPSDSGTYTVTVTASPSDTSLTSSASASVSVSISKKTLSFEWALDGIAIGMLTDEERTYSGVYKTLSSTASGVLQDDTTFSYTQSATQVRDAGTYSFYATLDGDWGEYYDMDGTYSGSLAILQYELTIDWVDADNLDLTYDGQDHNSAITYTLIGLYDDVLGDIMAITQNGSVAAVHNAGSYLATVTIENGNYTLSNPTLTFSVAKKTLTVSSWASETFTYDGTVHVQKVATFVGTVGEDNLGESYAIGGDNTTGINAGNYTSTVSISNGNYNLTGGNLTQGYSISPASIEVTWTYETIVYSGTAQHPEIASYGTLVGSDTITFSYTAGYKDVGSDYTVTATSNNANYTITSGATGTYSITAYSLAVTWEENLVYNGESQIVSREYGISKLGDDTITDDLLGITLEGYGTNVGTYTASISTWTNTNYTLTNTSQSYTISPAPLSVTWTYTETVYNGAAQHPEIASYGTLFGNDSITFSYTDGNNTNVGSGYTVTATSGNSNYTITSGGTCTYSITPAPLTVTWSDTSLTYNGAAQQPTITEYTETFNSDTVTFTYTDCSSNINVGNYSVTATSDDGNYTIANANCPYTISAYTLAITWGGETLTYNGSAQAPSHSFAIGTLGGDTINDTLLGVTVSGTETNAGNNYVVSITWTNGNYTLTNTSQTYSIAQKGVSVTAWSADSLVYNGAVQCPTATAFEGLVEGEDSSVLRATYSVTSGDGITVGSYEVAISINNSNYYLTGTTTHSYTITAAPLTVSGWTSTTLTYSGAQQYPTVIFSGTFGNDEVNATYSVTSGDGVNAGSHTVTITAIGNSNYSMPTEGLSTQYTILALDVTANWGDTSFVYDGSVHEVACTVIGADGNALDVSVSISGSDDATEAKDAGDYTATVSITDTTAAANYTITNPTKDVTVAKASVSVSWSGGTPSFACNGSSIDAETAGITCSYEEYDEATDNWTETDSIEDTGTYRATLTIAENGNYRFASGVEMTHEFTVTAD